MDREREREREREAEREREMGCSRTWADDAYAWAACIVGLLSRRKMS